MNLTKEQIEYWKKYKNKKTQKQIAADLGMADSKLRYLLRKADLTSRKWTKEEIDYIHENIENYTLKELVRKMRITGMCLSKKVRELGYTDILNKNKKKGQFKKGITPFNKGKKAKDYLTPEKYKKIQETWFKKGTPPHNQKKIGEYTIRSEGYVYEKIGEDEWEIQHKLNWERYHGRTYNTDTHCLWAIDGNSSNTDPRNWELITRKELCNRNNWKVWPEELKELKKLTGQLKKHINNAKKNRKNNTSTAK